LSFFCRVASFHTDILTLRFLNDILMTARLHCFPRLIF